MDTDTDIKHRVALRIRTIRKNRAMTQEKLAELIGRSVDAVSNLERGLSLPGFETLERLAKAMEVPIREFFDFEDDTEYGTERTRLLTELMQLARTLDKPDLELAVQLVEVLARRGEATEVVGRGDDRG